ncbi:MAG: serine protease [Acidimicrobiia bacterium]|nr:serine protease [Acidimicrobiia bacterium]
MKARTGGAIAVFLLASCTTPSTVATATEGSSTTSQPTTTSSVSGFLSPSQVFAAISPALAFIETSIGTGSGILMEGGKLLTNAHVVWPYAKARVVFPDGTELIDAPVVAWDVMGDFAVLDVSAAGRLPDPAPFGNGESESIGTELFLIGYPAEVERFPQPTLTSGVLSRIRTWDAIDMTYLQTDAVIAGGQSGGALVSNHGEVVGISGLLFAEGFALAASAPDVLPRIRAALSGETLDGLDARLLAGSGAPATEAEVELANFMDEATWVFSAAVGEDISFTADSRGDVALAVVSTDGFVELSVDDSETDLETGSFEVVVGAPHVISVTVISTRRETAKVASDVPFQTFVDPDHGRSIAPGESITANIDYPFDVDYFLLTLTAGQTVTVEVDTMNFDADLVIDRADNAGDLLASDDDTGGGVMGWDPLITYSADVSSTYLIGVFDQSGIGPGGYFLRVSAD